MASNSVNTDYSLVKGLKAGNHHSFRELFEKYGNSLYRFSFSYLKSECVAEDVVQEVFTKIWENREKLKTDTSFKSYLFTIALNAMRKQFIKLSKENTVKHDLLVDLSSARIENFDDNTNYDFWLNRLNELIKVMPEKRKMVFRKRKIEGKAVKEIAKELELSPKTVERHITEAMNFLKKEFEKSKYKGEFSSHYL